jgi:hypothetical protein
MKLFCWMGAGSCSKFEDSFLLSLLKGDKPEKVEAINMYRK